MKYEDNWQFYLDVAGEWRWRRTAANNEIIGASSEGYRNRQDCVANAHRHGYGGCSQLGADDKWEFYLDIKGKHRWKRWASNGVQVGSSSQGYSSKSYCEENARLHCYHG